MIPPRWWRIVLMVLGAGVAAVALRGRFPAWPAVQAGLVGADPAWLGSAAVLQVVAMGAASGQQQHLLAALRVRMSTAASLSVTYIRAAMSIGLPAGSALSTAYAFRQFRARGADSPTAAAVLVLCGVASVTSLALLYAVDLTAWALPRGGRYPALASGLALAVTLATAARGAGRRLKAGAGRRSGPATGFPGDTRRSRLLVAVNGTLRLTTTITVARWSVVGGLAALNWVADAASLFAAARAVGVEVPVREVLTAYLAVQLVRQVPITPGGIGVVEASLLVALTASGADDAAAAAGVLVYRVLSYWAVLPVGLACWTALRAAHRHRRGTAPEVEAVGRTRMTQEPRLSSW